MLFLLVMLICLLCTNGTVKWNPCFFSRWIVRQRISHTQSIISSNGEEIPGGHPSYRDALKVILGCKHYKRNCKLVTPCCNKLYTCIRCHDEVADHSTERYN